MLNPILEAWQQHPEKRGEFLKELLKRYRTLLSHLCDGDESGVSEKSEIFRGSMDDIKVGGTDPE